ncbi:L,D-transpeptidase [filamentous cyanobacterium CCP5]|nr:L,D-transpeptidase [filamentous cyanobacterium CCP5]
MIAPSPIRRTFEVLCYLGAALLTVGAWHDYRVEAQRRAAGLFDPGIFRRSANLIEFAPDSLANRGSLIVIQLSQRRVQLYRQDRVVESYPVGIGQNDWQTPVGEFVVQNMRRDPVWQHPITKEAIGPGPDNPLGSRWIGFWQDGRHYIGLHGTNQEDSIGRAVSHGCVRMREEDIQALFEQVSIGTPVVVER